MRKYSECAPEEWAADGTAHQGEDRDPGLGGRQSPEQGDNMTIHSLFAPQGTQAPKSDRASAEARRAELSAGKFIPTMNFQWYVDADGLRTLQQGCTTTGGMPFWRDVPKVAYKDG